MNLPGIETKTSTYISGPELPKRYGTIVEKNVSLSETKMIAIEKMLRMKFNVWSAFTVLQK